MPRKQIAIGLIWSNGRLAIGRRDKDAVLADYDEFPGGKCELDEAPEDAVRRECREETGLEVEVKQLRLQLDHDYAHGSLTLSFFDCEPISKGDEPSLAPPFEWWSIEEVLAGRFPEANAAVLDSLRDELRGKRS